MSSLFSDKQEISDNVRYIMGTQPSSRSEQKLRHFFFDYPLPHRVRDTHHDKTVGSRSVTSLYMLQRQRNQSAAVASLLSRPHLPLWKKMAVLQCHFLSPVLLVEFQCSPYLWNQEYYCEKYCLFDCLKAWLLRFVMVSDSFSFSQTLVMCGCRCAMPRLKEEWSSTTRLWKTGSPAWLLPHPQRYVCGFS